MVEIVLGVAVFVLTAAIIGLYAMMGELASRVPDSDRPAGDARLLRPVAGARGRSTLPERRAARLSPPSVNV